MGYEKFKHHMLGSSGEIPEKIMRVNTRPGGGLSHVRHGGGGRAGEGGGVKMTTPPNSKTKRNRRAWKTTFDCSE